MENPENPLTFNPDNRSAGDAGFDEDRVNIEVSEHLRNEAIFSEYGTFLAVKNPTSFLIAQRRWGFKLVEDSALIFSADHPEENPIVFYSQILYIEGLDYYLIFSPDQILRKDIDQNPPYPFLPGDPFAASYSSLWKRLAVAGDDRKISIFELETKRKALEVKSGFGAFFTDLILFGDEGHKLAYSTFDDYVGLLVLNFSVKKLCFRSELKLGGENEQISTLAVSRDNRHLLAQVAPSEGRVSNRLAVLHQEERRLVRKARIDQGGAVPVGIQSALNHCGSAGGCIFWVGLSMFQGTQAHLYCYDTLNEEFRELEQKRVPHRAIFPKSIERIGNQFYYIGFEENLMKLAVTI